MRKTTLPASLVLLSCLLSTPLLLVDFTAANPLPELPYITIESDGHINPQTDYLQQTGSTYLLTGNLDQKYSLIIKCSNMVLDGNGYRINGTAGTRWGQSSGYANLGLNLDHVTNVTVKDLEIGGFARDDIRIECCVGCCFFRVAAGYFTLIDSHQNTITASKVNSSLVMRYSNENLLIQNSFKGSSVDVLGNSNVWFENNFACEQCYVREGTNRWDNGSVGNYWSNYNGADGDGDAIGDKPHFLVELTADETHSKTVEQIRGQDNYPLMYPWGVPVVDMLDFCQHNRFERNLGEFHHKTNLPNGWATT
jgi:hypothetical protein